MSYLHKIKSASKYHILSSQTVLTWCVLIQIILSSCIESYDVDIKNANNILFVNGYFSEKEGKITIKNNLGPYEEAEVSVIDQNGKLYTFAENKPGVYERQNDDLAKVEMKYKLKIQIKGSPKVELESNFVEMLETSPIDSVYCKVEEQSTIEGDRKPVLQFYVSSSELESGSSYYLWELEETWKYSFPIYPDWLWVNGERKTYRGKGCCYITESVGGVYLHNTTSLQKNKVENHDLHFIPDGTPKLNVKYSVLTKQFSLSPDAYQYWKSIEQINSNQGSLFEQQPVNVLSNIKVMNNDNLHIVGYFIASQSSEKRIYTTHHKGMSWFKFAACVGDTIKDEVLIPENEFAVVNYLDFALGYKIMCAKCISNAGDLEAPDFWED